MNLTNLIIFVVVLLVVGTLSYSVMALSIKNKKLSKELQQAVLDKVALTKKLGSEIDARQATSIEKTDGFIKFLSESRDWAFEYIENVQQAIGAVKTSASFGKVSEESLVELFALLPENNEEKQK